MNRIIRVTRMFAVLAVGMLLLPACAMIQTPKSFAEVSNPGRLYKYRAITADEVVIGVRLRERTPKGDIEFWKEIFKKKIPQAKGYKFVSEQDAETNSGLKGATLLFSQQQGEKKIYLYQLTFFIDDDILWIIEAAGEESAFKKHESEISQAIKSFDP